MSSSSVILVHNLYKQSGGEDQVVRAEVELLRSRGHDAVVYSLDNAAIDRMGMSQLTRATFWNGAAYDELRALIRRHEPLVMHVHNTFPLVSPSAYYAARDEGIPVVQTLHNFRLVCPNGLLFRDGHVCEECVGKGFAWPGILHRCYRGSRAVTAATASMVTVHRARGTWSDVIDIYVALSKFSRGRFVAGGLPADRIVVKPNFLAHDPGVGRHGGGYALFVGRLSSEKGLRVLLQAWERVRTRAMLRIVGSGPLESELRGDLPGVEWLGRQPTERVMTLMQDATFLVLPSECYENFPVTIVEAFATGLPVLASRIGSLAELVRDSQTGLHFRVGDPADLAAKIDWAFENVSALAVMGVRARAEFDSQYRADSNYLQLMAIYRSAAERAGALAHA